MNKYIYILFVSVIVVLAITAIFFPWSQLTYQTHKNDLLAQENFETISPNDFSINIQTISQEGHYTVIVTFDDAQTDLTHFKALLVDGREVTNPTNQFYPSIGLISDFDLSLVKENFDAVRQQGIVLIYETDIAHPLVYVWVSYTCEDGSSEQHYFALQG